MKAIVWLLLMSSGLLSDRAVPTSSDIADAAERITGRRAHMSADIRLLAGQRLVGPAITMRAVRDDTASSTGEGLKAIRVLEDAAPGSVIVLLVDGEKDFAVFGATFATLAKSRNLAGFVIDGAMRGVQEFRRLDLPLFARGTVAGSAGGHYRLETVHAPIHCGGIEIVDGDVIVGDEDGIAVAAKDHRDEIFAHAARLHRQKEAMLPLITRFKSYTKAAEAYAKKAKGRT
jgi:4-hydroxy-4-methyl-2-oxoglutarate aldolase